MAGAQGAGADGGRGDGEGRRYGGRSAEQRDADRLERLRAGALDLFGTVGYQAVTVEQVCARARVSSRHFYQLFRTKEDALVDVYEWLTSAAFATAAQVLEDTAAEHYSDRLTGAVRAYLEPMLADPRRARVAFVEVVGVSARVEDVRLRYRAAIVAMFVAGGELAVERGELAPRDFAFLGLAFLGAVNTVVPQWATAEHRSDAAALEAKLCRLALDLVEKSASPN